LQLLGVSLSENFSSGGIRLVVRAGTKGRAMENKRVRGLNTLPDTHIVLNTSFVTFSMDLLALFALAPAV
jgi:hypothetical protein